MLSMKSIRIGTTSQRQSRPKSTISFMACTACGTCAAIWSVAAVWVMQLCFKSLHENSAWKCCIKVSLIHHSSKGRGFLWESLVQPLLWWRIPEETTSIHDFLNINHQRLKLCLFWKWIHSTWIHKAPFSFQSKHSIHFGPRESCASETDGPKPSRLI